MTTAIDVVTTALKRAGMLGLGNTMNSADFPDAYETLGTTTPWILALDPLERISARTTELCKYVVFRG